MRGAHVSGERTLTRRSDKLLHVECGAVHSTLIPGPNAWKVTRTADTTAPFFTRARRSAAARGASATFSSFVSTAAHAQRRAAQRAPAIPGTKAEKGWRARCATVTHGEGEEKALFCVAPQNLAMIHFASPTSRVDTFEVFFLVFAPTRVDNDAGGRVPAKHAIPPCASPLTRCVANTSKSRRGVARCGGASTKPSRGVSAPWLHHTRDHKRCTCTPTRSATVTHVQSARENGEESPARKQAKLHFGPAYETPSRST